MKVTSAITHFWATAFALSNSPHNAGRYTFAALYDQSFLEGYSVIKHIGGCGPYSNRQSYGIGRDPPDGCAVDQVIMIRRHGERYPQAVDGAKMKRGLQKLQDSNITDWRGDLRFLPDWEFYVTDEGLYELETDTGPYSGLLTTYKHGSEYRTRYGHLWDQSNNTTIPMWTAEFERVVQTARKFGQGFFGWNYTNTVALNMIPETTAMGANSLTPRCPADNRSACSRLTYYMPQFDVAASRLNKQNPGLHLNSSDVYGLMLMSAYELNVRGFSEWTNVFTLDEWLSFGYTQDLQFYYCAGPGNPYMKAVGGVYMNASLALMKRGPRKSGGLIFNFSHDTNITPILAALGIGTPEKHLPKDRLPFPNTYATGNLMPMGGHLTFERLSCNATTTSKKDTFVRVVLNEAVVPFNDCQDGPGFSCSLANYTKLVENMLEDYVQTCKVNASMPHYLDFWWNYNTTTEFTTQHEKYIPYQGSGVV